VRAKEGDGEGEPGGVTLVEGVGEGVTVTEGYRKGSVTTLHVIR